MSLFNYECDEVKRIIDEVSPNYPQLTTYEKEWIFFHKYHYNPGFPVELEYETVTVNPYGMVTNAIPHNYKSAILKGNTDENLQSVKMPVLKTVGNNLLEWQKLFTNELVDGYETNKGKNYVPVRIPVPNVNEQYTLVFSGKIDDFGSDADFMKTFAVTVYYTDETKSQKYAINDNTTLTTIKGKIIDRIEISHPFAETKPDYTARIKDIALYQGSVAIPYEPYKSNILTVNEDVTLRSNGDICDELNLLTGQLTQRIGEDGVVLSQEVVKTVDLTKLTKPYEGTNHYQLTSNIPCEVILEVPVVSTGKQTLEEINND